MDSSSSFHAKTLYLTGSYKACIVTVNSEPVAPSLSLQLYAARAHIALGQTDDAAELLQTLPQSDLGVRTVTLLAEFVGTGESVIDELREIVAEANDDENPGCTRAVAGTILQLEGETGEALHVLGEGVKREDQECVAVQIQILLSLDRVQAARQIYQQAKTWADDSILIQLCEAWIGLKSGGEQQYQAAYYVYDEIAQLPSANNVVVLNGKAVAQAAMNHWPEADAALGEAQSVNAEHATTLANQVALTLPSSKPAASAEPTLERLRTLAPSHLMLADLQAKSALFDEAASRFKPSAISAAA